MNRLVLLGNGFDLAHGLPTSYNDFILWYLKDFISQAVATGVYGDELMTVQITYQVASLTNGSITNDSLIEHFYNNNFETLLKKPSLSITGYGALANPYKFSNVSPLLQKLLANCNTRNWVEIENEYYGMLKKLLKTQEMKAQCQKLNEGLRGIIKHLGRYLKTIPIPQRPLGYRRIFQTPFQNNEFKAGFLDSLESKKLGEVCLLNFNYTNTINMYSDRSDWIDTTASLNYIHGNIYGVDNPLIFGFGDELDKQYEEIENCGENEFFRYIKSFWYLRTSGYYNLLRFVDSDDFQIYVVGHSCGLSDRTMLNMLFKHPKCRSIKIYYHKRESGKDNFTEITQEISRHFKNKEMMREKVVNFDFCEPMPQAKRD